VNKSHQFVVPAVNANISLFVVDVGEAIIWLEDDEEEEE
jgi:hypothetical protein